MKTYQFVYLDKEIRQTAKHHCPECGEMMRVVVRAGSNIPVWRCQLCGAQFEIGIKATVAAKEVLL